MPFVSMEEAMMESAEQDEVIEICFASIGPMLNVMDLEPSGSPASRVPTMPTVTLMDQSSKPTGSRSTVSTDTDHNRSVSDHGFERTVT